MSMVALISTVTNRSRRVVYQEVISASLVNANTIFGSAIEIYTPQELAAAQVVNAPTLYAASAEIYEPTEVVAAYFINAATVYAGEVAFVPPPGGEQQLTAAHCMNSATTYVASLVEKFSPPATSYLGYLATGDRKLADMSIRGNNPATPAAISDLIDGNLANNTYYFAGGVTDSYLLFEFLNPVLITEARLTQGNDSVHGDWQWQGSDDGASWTDIGSPFEFGGDEVTLQTSLNPNSTYYNFYRVIQDSGVTSGSPFVHEMEFKILIEETGVSFDNAATFGKGDRSGLIGITHTGFSSLFSDEDNLINDALDNDFYCSGGTGDAWLTFDFGVPVNIRGLKLIRSNGSVSGGWTLQASTDGSSFSNVSPEYQLDEVISTVFASNNEDAYRYYRFALTSGSASGSPYWQETYFAQGTASIYIEAAAAHVASAGATISGALIEQFEGAPPDDEQLATAALVTNTSTVYAAASAELLDFDPLWSNVVALLDTSDHSAAAEGQRVRHHSADGGVGQTIPATNTYYTTAQKLAGRDYSIGGGTAAQMIGLFGIDLNSAGGFTLEGRVRRSNTLQSLLFYQGVGGNVFRFGFEAGANARLMFSYSTNGVSWTNVFSIAAAVSSSHAFKHIAVDRDASDVLRMFVDGVMVAKSTLGGVIASPIETKVNVGASLGSGAGMFIDDVRMTLGASRYGSDSAFTPPASLPRGPANDADWDNVVALQRFDTRIGMFNTSSNVFMADASPANLPPELASGVEVVITDTLAGPDTTIWSTGGGYARSKAGALGSNFSGGIAWTIDVRAQISGTGDAAGLLVSQETAYTSSPGSADRQWRIGMTSDRKPYFAAELVGGSTFTITSPDVLEVGDWYDLAVDCDGEGVRLYVDGDMVVSGTMSADIANHSPTTMRLYLFGGGGSGGAGFPGYFEEVRVTRDVARYDSDAGYTPLVGRFPAY
jgi:hypothetical protein